MDLEPNYHVPGAHPAHGWTDEVTLKRYECPLDRSCLQELYKHPQPGKSDTVCEDRQHCCVLQPEH